MQAEDNKQRTCRGMMSGPPTGHEAHVLYDGQEVSCEIDLRTH